MSFGAAREFLLYGLTRVGGLPAGAVPPWMRPRLRDPFCRKSEEARSPQLPSVVEEAGLELSHVVLFLCTTSIRAVHDRLAKTQGGLWP